MISEVLGLLLGQIAVLSLERFFKAMPRQWIRKYIHPIIREFLRCDIPINASYSNKAQSESIQSSTLQQCQRIHMRMQIIIDSINQALLNLHNYDKQLIKFEETFVGSAIILIIIFGILLTILLWLRRLSYTLPYEFPENYKRYQPGEKERSQEISVSKSLTTGNLVKERRNTIEKSQVNQTPGRSSAGVSILEPEINSSNNTIKPCILMEKAVVNFNEFQTTISNKNERGIEMKFNSQKYEEICKTTLSDDFNNNTDRQIKRRTLSREVKRQRYESILLFLSDELSNNNISRPSTKVHHPARIAKRTKQRYIRIF